MFVLYAAVLRVSHYNLFPKEKVSYLLLYHKRNKYYRLTNPLILLLRLVLGVGLKPRFYPPTSEYIGFVANISPFHIRYIFRTKQPFIYSLYLHPAVP